MENEESRMYSASILFVYEGDLNVLQALLAAEEESQASSQLSERPAQKAMLDSSDEDEDDVDDDDDEDEARICTASLIDFAHASFTPGEGSDENALRGVRNVRILLDSFLLP